MKTNDVRVFDCLEQEFIEVSLADVLGPDGTLKLNPEVQGKGYFDVRLRRGGTLGIQARGWVGMIPLTDSVVVHVKPRAPVANLTRMADIAGSPTTALTIARTYAPSQEWNDSFADMYASALAQHLEQMGTRGLYRTYERREGSSSFPHGRIQMAATVSRHAARGVNHAAHFTWFERTPDNPLNQCIKYAIWFMVQRYIRRRPIFSSARRVHRELVAHFALLDGVTLDHGKRFLTDPLVVGQRPLPPLRGYYRDALDLSLAIIGQEGLLLDHPSGSLKLPSLILNMDTLFETYVRRVLQLRAVEDAWPTKVKDGNIDGHLPLYSSRGVLASLHVDGQPIPEVATGLKNPPFATPDIVLTLPGGSTPLVVEVKNRPIEGSGLSKRDDVNQAVTYAVRYKTDRALLVSPRSTGHAGGLHLLGDIGGVAVFQYRYDLAAADLPGEDSRFGRAVAALLPAAATAPLTSSAP